MPHGLFLTASVACCPPSLKVLTDFDPKMNANAPLWFEKLFLPNNKRNDFTPSGIPYPSESP